MLQIRRKFVEIITLMFIVFAFGFFFWAAFFNSPHYNKELIASVKDFNQNALLMILAYYMGVNSKDVAK